MIESGIKKVKSYASSFESEGVVIFFWFTFATSLSYRNSISASQYVQ